MLATLLSCLAVICCSPVEAPLPEPDAGDEITVGVDVSILSADKTRSSVCAGDDSWVNMTVWQFLEDGSLYRSYFSESPDAPFSVKGRLGVTYRFCAVLNFGDRRAEVSSESDIANVRFTTSSMAALTGSSGLPMSSALQSVPFTDNGLRFSLEFVRLVSKFNFSLLTSGITLGTFTPVSVRIRQSPLSVCPFVVDNQASRPSDVSDGDYANEADVSTLCSGGKIVLYALENCQGTLLPDNSSPRAKIPENIGRRKDICTYLELVGDYEHADGSMTSVNTYRMYLGEDNCTNFDVTRNTVHNITLSLSDWGDAENYWKAERVVTRIPSPEPYVVSVEQIREDDSESGLREWEEFSDSGFEAHVDLTPSSVGASAGSVEVAAGASHIRTYTLMSQTFVRTREVSFIRTIWSDGSQVDSDWTYGDWEDWRPDSEPWTCSVRVETVQDEFTLSSDCDWLDVSGSYGANPDPLEGRTAVITCFNDASTSATGEASLYQAPCDDFVTEEITRSEPVSREGPELKLGEETEDLDYFASLSVSPSVIGCSGGTVSVAASAGHRRVTYELVSQSVFNGRLVWSELHWRSGKVTETLKTEVWDTDPAALGEPVRRLISSVEVEDGFTLSSSGSWLGTDGSVEANPTFSSRSASITCVNSSSPSANAVGLVTQEGAPEPVLVDITVTVEDVEVGSSFQASARADFSDGSSDSDPAHFLWSCDGPVSIDADGTVTGVGSGDFTVYAQHVNSSMVGGDSAHSQAFAIYEFDFGGFYDIEGVEEDLADKGPVRYESGSVVVSVCDDYGNSVSCTCSFTLGYIGTGNTVHYVSFDPGESTPGSGKLVDGGNVTQSVSSSIGSAFLAPGSDVPVFLSGGGSLVSEEAGIRF